jgi:1-acyl-sn-glycerol-3-phosphate acyltransferase
MKKTIFNTPVVNSLFRTLSLIVLKIIGWKVVGTAPDKHRFILICAPHTSNWDFPLMLLGVFVLRMDVHWMGKASLFPWYIRGLAKWLGGIPIDRSRNNNIVDQCVEHFAVHDELIVLLTPEGTRNKVSHWKTGFYHIAYGAQVPVVLASVDTRTKEIEIGPGVLPGGDMDADMAVIKRFYAGKVGVKARLT